MDSINKQQPEENHRDLHGADDMTFAEIGGIAQIDDGRLLFVHQARYLLWGNRRTAATGFVDHQQNHCNRQRASELPLLDQKFQNHEFIACNRAMM